MTQISKNPDPVFTDLNNLTQLTAYIKGLRVESSLENETLELILSSVKQLAISPISSQNNLLKATKRLCRNLLDEEIKAQIVKLLDQESLVVKSGTTRRVKAVLRTKRPKGASEPKALRFTSRPLGDDLGERPAQASRKPDRWSTEIVNVTKLINVDSPAGKGLVIEPEVEMVLPKISNYTTLKNDIKKHGLKNPIRYWIWDGQKIIVDGCNCFRACLELGIEVKAVEENFATLAEALCWRIDINSNRRQLSPVALKYLIGAKYVIAVESKIHREFNAEEKFAEFYDKTTTTIRNYGSFYRAVMHICRKLPEEAEDFKAKLFAGEIKYSLENIKKVAAFEITDLAHILDYSRVAGKLPIVPSFKNGSLVRIGSIPNKSADAKYNGRTGIYCGLGAFLSALVNIDNAIISVSFDQLEVIDSCDRELSATDDAIETDSLDVASKACLSPNSVEEESFEPESSATVSELVVEEIELDTEPKEVCPPLFNRKHYQGILKQLEYGLKKGEVDSDLIEKMKAMIDAYG